MDNLLKNLKESWNKIVEKNKENDIFSRIIKCYEILKSHGCSLGGGNCGMAAIAILEYLKDKNLKIAFVTDVITDDELLDGEPDIYHVAISHGNRYFDEMGEINVKYLQKLALDQYGKHANIINYKYLGGREVFLSIIRNNTNWNTEWKSMYKVLKTAGV